MDHHTLGVQSRYQASFSKNKILLKHVMLRLKCPDFSQGSANQCNQIQQNLLPAISQFDVLLIFLKNASHDLFRLHSVFNLRDESEYFCGFGACFIQLLCSD